MTHPLDRPVWSALTGRQSHLAITQAGAVRMDPAFGLFAALEREAVDNLAALGDLVSAHGVTGLVELAEVPAQAGVERVSAAVCWQMISDALTPARPAVFDIVQLTDADAPEMLALATLTKPGPFFARTHELGAFVGVKVDGKLAAMAGERLRPEGFTEVSGVCTHPDHRGKGYAAQLMRHVAGRILAAGETPFLHSYADNVGANRLYESLGFRLRREVVFTVLKPA
jgi:predicted GNAT family acetyltransferase